MVYYRDNEVGCSTAKDKVASATVAKANLESSDAVVNSVTTPQADYPLFSIKNNDTVIDAENAFISVILFEVLTKITGLPPEFHQSLLRISEGSESLSSKLGQLHAVLEQLQLKTGGKTRHYLDRYLQLVRLAARLQLSTQNEECITTLFTDFLQTSTDLLDSDFIRDSIPASVVDSVIQISRHSKSIIALFDDFNNGHLLPEQIIPRLLDNGLMPASLETALSSLNILIALWQRYPLSAMNVNAFSEWLMAILQDREALSLLNAVLPPELQSLLQHIFSDARLVKSMRQNETTWAEWFSWLCQQGVAMVPEQQRAEVTAWMLSPDSQLRLLIQRLETLYTLSMRHPLSSDTSVTSWLLDLLLDEQSYPILAGFLPKQITEIMALSSPLLRIANHYPITSSVGQQLSWVAQEVYAPSPELQTLFAHMPTDAFIRQIHYYIGQHAIGPDTLDLILTLADPGISLKQKAGMLFQQLTGQINLQQAISAVVRNYVPYGGLMVGLWNWYQSQPEHLTWASAKKALSDSLAQQWPAEAALVDNLLNGSWQEVGEKIADLIKKSSPEVRWVYLRYLELSLLWSGKELLMASSQTTYDGEMQQMLLLVRRYFSVLDLPFPNSLLLFTSDLELLLSMSNEIRLLPRDSTWLNWLSGLFQIIERHPRAAQFRQKIEGGVQDAVRTILGEHESETASQIIDLMRRQMTIPLAKKVDSEKENILFHDAENEPTTSTDKWHRNQARHKHHRKRAQQRRHRQRQHRQVRRAEHEPVPHQMAQRHDNEPQSVIPLRTIRNVAIGVAGLYLFSRFGVVEATPATNEEKWQLANADEREITEFEGKSFMLFGSSFDEAEYWRKIWSRFSTLSLGAGLLSVPAIILYRFFRAQASKRHQTSVADIGDIELQNLNIENHEERSAGDTGAITINREDNQTPFLFANYVSEQSESNGNIIKNYIPEIMAMLTLFAGTGGYLYGKNREKYHERHAEQLVETAADTNPVIKITPTLLEVFDAESRPEMSDTVTPEEIAMLAQSSDQAVTEKNARQKRKTEDYISVTLKSTVARRWHERESFPVGSGVTLSSSGIYSLGNQRLLKIDESFWAYVPEEENVFSGEIVNYIKREKIKVFKGKDDKWTLARYAEVIHNGKALIEKMVTLNDYSEKVRTLIEFEIEIILRGREYIEFETFRKLLLETLLLLFLRKKNDMSLGVELLQAISEIKNDKEQHLSPAENLLRMTSQESAVPENYYALLDETISNPTTYCDAISEFMGGQGIRAETLALIRSGTDVINSLIKAVEEEVGRKINVISDKIKKLQAGIIRARSNDYILVEANKGKRRSIKNLNKSKKSLLDKKAEIIKMLKSSAENIKEASADFHTINIEMQASEQEYLAGIKLAESYIGKLPLTFKEYNKAYFSVLKDELVTRSKAESAIVSYEKFRAAKLHLNAVYASSHLLSKLLAIIPANLSSIILTPDIIMQTHHDYRDFVLAEIAAAEIYNKKRDHFNTLFTNVNSDSEFYDAELLLAAILFFRLRRHAERNSIENYGIKEIVEYYFKSKRSEHPFKNIGEVPIGYYSLKDFKKREFFDNQYDYNEQFNVYIDKYLMYDVEVHSLFTVESVNVPMYQLLSPMLSLETFSFEFDTASMDLERIYPKFRGKASAIQMMDRNWLLLFTIDGRVKSIYLDKQSIQTSPFKPFIKPQSFFGKRKVFLPSEVLPGYHDMNDLYPPDSLGDSEVLEYQLAFESLGYKFGGVPVFFNTKNTHPTISLNQTVLHYTQEFIRDNYRHVVNSSKAAQDRTGFWHHLAALVIPFYDVVYKSVTDRHYTLSGVDVVSIIIDVLSVIGFIANLALKAYLVTDRLAISVTQKYCALIKSGVSRNAAMMMIIRDLPTVVTNIATLPFLKALKSELINLINPLPFDIERFSSNLYRFSLDSVSNISSGVKGLINKLPVKIRKEWKVKDANIVHSLEKISHNDDFIYSLKTSAKSEAESKFIKIEGDYYPAVPSGSKDWFISSPESVEGAESRMFQAVFRQGNEWLPYPVDEGRLTNLAGNLSNTQRQFGPVRVPIGLATRSIIRHSRLFRRTMHFSSVSNEFRVDRTFTVVPIDIRGRGVKSSTLPASTAIAALEKVSNQSHELISKWNNLPQEQKERSQSNINFILLASDLLNKYIRSLRDDNRESVLFALVKKSDGWQTDPDSVYALSELYYNIDDDELVFDSLAAHPYTIAARDNELKNFISADEVSRYKLKGIAMHLGASSIRQALDFHNGIPGSRPIKYLSTQTANPIVEALIQNLNIIHERFDLPLSSIRQRASATVDNLGNFITRRVLRRGPNVDPHELEQSCREAVSRMLSTLPGQGFTTDGVAGMINLTDLKPLKNNVYADPALVKDYRDALMAMSRFSVVAEDIRNLNTAQMRKYGHFAQQVISASDELVTTLDGISNTINKAKNDPALKERVTEYFINAFKLNKEPYLKSKASSLTNEVIAEKIFNRFEEVVTRSHEFMVEQKNNGYKNFSILSSIPGDSVGKSNAKKLYGLSLKNDPDKKIYLVFNESNRDAEALKYNLAHEVTHISSATEDLSYFNNVRIFDHKDISTLDVTDKRYFFENKELANKTTGYIFNLNQQVHITEELQSKAASYFVNNNLVRADVLLHTAEFDTMLIKEFSKIFNATGRIRRDVSEQDQQPALYEIILTLILEDLLNHVDLSPEEVLISQINL